MLARDKPKREKLFHRILLMAPYPGVLLNHQYYQVALGVDVQSLHQNLQFSQLVSEIMK